MKNAVSPRYDNLLVLIKFRGHPTGYTQFPNRVRNLMMRSNPNQLSRLQSEHFQFDLTRPYQLDNVVALRQIELYYIK